MAPPPARPTNATPPIGAPGCGSLRGSPGSTGPTSETNTWHPSAEGMAWNGDCAARPDRNEIVVVGCSNVAWRKRDQGLSTPRSGDKFNDDRVEARYDDRAQIAAPKSMLRQISVEYDNIEQLRIHWLPPGYAVTNRGKSSPLRTSISVRTLSRRRVQPLLGAAGASARHPASTSSITWRIASTG